MTDSDHYSGTGQVTISIVVPLYNESENIRLLYESIVDAIADFRSKAEVIFVDDGSSDNTFDLARTLASADPRLRVIKFRRNYGQTPAMAAGIDLARGEIVVTMDGDLQNDPKDIPRMITTMEQGFDIVVGWRYDRQDKLVSRKIPSRIANWLIGKVTGVPIKDNGCSLKVFRASIIKKVPLYSEMHRFIPAMASIAGPRIAEVKVRHHARRFGESKYGLSRIYKVLLDLLTIKTIASFSARPLYWFASLAAPFLVVSLLMILIVIVRFVGNGDISLPVGGSALFFLTLSLFLFFGGVFGELISRTGFKQITRFHSLAASEFVSRPRAGSTAEDEDNET